jgi:hypothetical protein
MTNPLFDKLMGVVELTGSNLDRDKVVGLMELAFDSSEDTAFNPEMIYRDISYDENEDPLPGSTRISQENLCELPSNITLMSS